MLFIFHIYLSRLTIRWENSFGAPLCNSSFIYWK